MDRPLSSAIANVRREFPALLVLSFFINLLALTLPLYCMQIFTRVLDSGSGETLLVLTFLAVFALAVFGYLTWLRTKWLALMADRFDSGLSAPIQTAAILENARGRVRSSSEGMRDLATLRSAISGGEARGLFDLPWAPFFFLVLYLLHPAFFFVTLAGALLLLGLAVANYLHARPILKEATTNSAASHNAGISMARNSEALMGMRMMRDAVARWSGLHGKSVASQSDALQRSGGYMAFASATRMILQVTIFGVGAYLVIQHNASAGLMIAAVFLAQRALAPFETAIASVRSTINGLAAYRRLDRLLDEKHEVATDKMRLPAPLGAITATNLVKMSPDGSRMILKGISFQIPSGAVLGIVGASASGKTTLAKVLVGVWKADKGVVRLDGAKIEDWRDDELSQYVGYLPQDVELFPGSVRDNIARLGMPDDEAVIEAAKAAGCHELILHLPQAYDTEVGDGGIFLSGGQRQRIALARALYRRPKLIVLDEPNSNLDAFGESALVAAIKRAQGWGATVIIVVHRPSLLRDATFVLALNDGHLQMFGSPQEVLPRLTAGGAAPARIITGRSDDSQAASAAGAAP